MDVGEDPPDADGQEEATQLPRRGDGLAPSRDGAYIEQIGTYDPRREPSVIEIDNDKAVDWLRKGAQPTDRARKLLEISGAWTRFRVAKGDFHTIGEPVPGTAPVTEVAAEDTDEPVTEAADEAPAEVDAVEEPVAEAPVAEAVEAAGEPEVAGSRCRVSRRACRRGHRRAGCRELRSARGADRARRRAGRGACRRARRRRGREVDMTKPEIADRVLRYVVENIVDEPSAITIDMIEEGDAAATAEVKTAKGDMGRVIGRRGRTARSIRTIVNAAGEEEGIDVRVEFLD